MTTRPSRLVLLGHPVRHSLSPLFQNAALRSAGIPITYEAIDVTTDALPGAVRALIAQGAAGNVTTPHKERVAALCATLTDVAASAGAVNTFWTSDGRLHGDNTDAGAVEASLAALLGRQPERVQVALLGAGGAACAVLAALARCRDSRVVVHNRTPDRAEAVARRFHAIARAATTVDEALTGADVVINATSLGMTDDRHPVSLDLLPPGAAVLDLVYRRGVTDWVRAARARGLRAMDGLPMLIEQGALAFERWLGEPAPREIMRAAVQ